MLSIYIHISSSQTQTTPPAWTGAHLAANPPDTPLSHARSLRPLSGWERCCGERSRAAHR